jgi:Sulfotransferase family
VFTHRDPYRVVLSSAAVMDAICTPFCVEGARILADDGHHDRQTLVLLTAAATAMEHFSAAHAERIVHVHYPDLLADPVATTHATFEALALPLPPGAPERIEAFLHRQRHGHRAAPLGSYDDYGYTFDDVWAEPALAAYCSTFDVQPEPKRLVEPAPRTERRPRASAGA